MSNNGERSSVHFLVTRGKMGQKMRRLDIITWDQQYVLETTVVNFHCIVISYLSLITIKMNYCLI